MASSQVEIVASSSPFGCVLKDHNGRDRYRKKNDHDVCVQQNLKDYYLVQSCSCSTSPRESENANSMAQSQEKKGDKWAKAREIVFDREPSRAVSSLVQKWRDFEAESKNLNSNYYTYNSPTCSSRSNSGSTFTENSQVLDVQSKNSDVTESVVERLEAPSIAEESLLDSESEKTGPSRDSNSTEKERIRVADIIKKLRCVNGEDCNEQFAANVPLPKLRTCIDIIAAENRGGGVVLASPRLRGRRAYNDLLLHLEHDRHGEIERLGERKAVSKFSHRGRLQALLKVRLLRHAKEVKEVGQMNALASDRKNHSNGSSVMHLRERFNTGFEHIAVVSSPRREVVHNIEEVQRSCHRKEVKNNIKEVNKSSVSTHLKDKEAISKIEDEKNSCHRKEVRNNIEDVHKSSATTHLKDKEAINKTEDEQKSFHRKEVTNKIKDVNKVSASTQLKEIVDHTSGMEDLSTSNQLRVVVDHDPNAENPTTSPQQKKEIHFLEGTHPKSPCKTVVDVTSNVDISTCNNIEADVNQSADGQYPYSSKTLKDIIRQWEQTQLRSPRKNVAETLDVEACSSSTSDRVKIDISHHDVISPQQTTSQLQNTETPNKEDSPNIDVLLQDTTFDSGSIESHKSVDNATSPDVSKSKNEAELKFCHEQSMVSLDKWVEDSSFSKTDWEEEQPDTGHLVENYPDWRSNFSREPSEWEEDQSYQLMEDTSLDWIYDVSRPRSDWESLRQERYQEMLDPFSGNRDIKKLLESKTVSSFLTSGLRDRIDQLMISRTQGQPVITDNRVEPVKKAEVVREVEKYKPEKNEQEEGGVECPPVQEEEDVSLLGRQRSEADEYSDQTPSMTSASPDIFGPWSHNRDNYISDDSLASPSLQKYSSFDSHTLENPQFSSLKSNPPTTAEMELISDLRGHMEQLHKEIFDLRNSLHSCMEMQMKMQHYMMREAAGFRSHPAQNRGTESIDRIPRKGACCLCYDAEVDSLLYRCGHMCTCYKCANELQRHSGKCPICQASILDVVRTYTDYR